MVETAAFHLSPLLPWPILGPLLGLAALAVLAMAGLRARGLGWRTLMLATVALALINPSLVREQREPLTDVAVIVLDESPSQELGDRLARSDAALAELRGRLEAFDGLEVRVVRSGADFDPDLGETRLIETLEEAVADVPRRRLAGAFLITDGQVHDVPEAPERLRPLGPIHALLTGERDEADRRLLVRRAPSYGLVGGQVTVTVRVDDLPSRGGGGLTRLRAIKDGEHEREFTLPVGQDSDLTFTLDHAGQTVIELEVEPGPNELSLANNRAVIVVNGVRDRLRVLLVSGEPHAGERTWRAILKSDPSVDLVHFTILRPPEKQDATPIHELSLISFPIRELFELRVHEFDLIIFDRYRRRGILPSQYLANIANYVLQGGAFLEASGPQFASMGSLYRTPLGVVLPGEPTGQVFEQGFRPGITDLGRRHPVTSDLLPPGQAEPGWGRWFRQIDVRPTTGSVLMDGVAAQPLLMLDRMGEGRVAQFTSDHMWLWSRGFEGGGPQAELLRRLAHWLMKEPDLEEEDLRADVDGRRIAVEHRTLGEPLESVAVTAPDGRQSVLPLEGTAPGRATGLLLAEAPGIYRFQGGERLALAVVGTLNPPELIDMRTTDEPLRPVAEATGGAIHWLADGDPVALPEIRQVLPDRAAAGRGWIGLRQNDAYVVTGVRDIPVLPGVLALLLALGALLAGWRREGR